MLSVFCARGRRFCHKTMPGKEAQLWHRDTFWGRRYPRNHRPYWLMALYFPQDTTFEMGPTGLLPRSHYFTRDADPKVAKQMGDSKISDRELASGKKAETFCANTHWHLREVAPVCKAGSIVLMHYDLWHRGAKNTSASGVRLDSLPAS